MAIRLRTPRLLLREWRDEDFEPFAAMSADPEVMELLLGPYDRAKSDEWVAWARDFWREHAYGIWVVELPDEAPFVGSSGSIASPSRRISPRRRKPPGVWRDLIGDGELPMKLRAPSSRTGSTA